MEERKTLRSCRGQGVHAESIVDRFTNLPDQVAHHILSFLAITDLTLFGCASKRCRELYLSTPTLNFNEFSVESRDTCKNRQRLLNSLDRFLVYRGDNKMRCFHCSWSYHDVDDVSGEPLCTCDNEDFRIITWIHNAVRCNVEVLDLKFFVGYEVPLAAFPPCIFLCGSLRSLKVKKFEILKAPSITSLSNLKHLILKDVHIVDPGFFKWITYCCKCIKDLHLLRVNGLQNITIESLSLELFEFVNCGDLIHLSISGEKLEEIDMDWTPFYPEPIDKSLRIHAPNLKNLKWKGSLSKIVHLGKFRSLEKAELFLDGLTDIDNVYKVLCSVRKVKVLTLNKATTEAMLKAESKPPFDHICYFGIHIGSFADELVQPMASLFKGMPNLHTLFIKSGDRGLYSNFKFSVESDTSSGFNMGYWMLQNFAFKYQLKEVSIELCNGSNGIELARYLLKHALNLERMAIIHSPQQSKAISDLKKVELVTNATVVFEEDPVRKTRLRSAEYLE